MRLLSRLAFSLAVVCFGLAGYDATGAGPDMNARDEATRAAKASLLLVRLEGVGMSFNAMTDGRVAGYRLTPLFTQQVDITDSGRQVIWLLAIPGEDILKNDGGGWEKAHRFVANSRENPQLRGAQDIYAEPNTEHKPVIGDEASNMATIAAAVKAGKPPVSPPWPYPPSFAWHLDSGHSQLIDARKAARKGACMPRLISLDTGIHAAQVTTPQGIDLTLAKNFVEGGNIVEDPGHSGGLKNPGHGTATIALLAGNHITVTSPPFDDYLGGAPDAKVVPVRIADSVVHFWTDEMAKGIDYASNLPKGIGNGYCDVVSISMGGVASRAWAHAVNKAYDGGVTIVAAAGNNFDDFPTRFTVYPGRFARVIAATGATSDCKPYRTTKRKIMQGNYGPKGVMRTAIAAYTPNVPWADFKTTDTIDRDGAGTSAATPQVAAAAMLWLQTYADKYKGGWPRVEAVRHALFKTAEKKFPTEAVSKEYFGNGLLRAADALKHVPAEKDLEKQPEDEVSFPFFRILLGWEEPNDGRQRMYEVEALNLALESKTFSMLTLDKTDDGLKKFGPKTRDEFIDYLVHHPRASRDLKDFLVNRFGRK